MSLLEKNSNLSAMTRENQELKSQVEKLKQNNKYIMEKLNSLGKTSEE